MNIPNKPHKKANRSGKRSERQKGQMRAKLILLNSAVALIIIMIVLVCKLVSLNSVEKSLPDSVETAENTTEKEKDSDTETEAVETEPVETAEPVQVQVNGTQQWIRKDLDKDKPMVALTFDDGPYPPVTNKILKILKKYDAEATFFCVGSRVSQYPEAVQAAYAQGCQVASHTYGHVTLTGLKKKKIKQQIVQANDAIFQTIGCLPTALRPPGGKVNNKVRAVVDMPLICWSVDSEDWKSRNKKKILKRCKNITDGDIVLMHDLYSSTATAVAKLVPQLVKQGFQLVTVDELFYYRGISLEDGEVYYSAK